MTINLHYFALAIAITSLFFTISSSNGQVDTIFEKEVEFHLFGKQVYLPREKVLFKSIGWNPLEIRLSASEEISCGGNEGRKSVKEETVFNYSGFSAANFTCSYTGTSKKVTIKLKYKLGSYQLRSYEYSLEKVQKLQQEITALKEMDKTLSEGKWNSTIEEYALNSGIMRKSTQTISSNKEYVQFDFYSEQTKLELIRATGTVTVGFLRTEYDSRGIQSGIHTGGRRGYLSDMNEPYSLICGEKSPNGYKKVLLNGGTLSKADFKGFLHCSVNGKKGKFYKNKGSYRVTIEALNKDKLRKKVKSDIAKKESFLAKYEAEALARVDRENETSINIAKRVFRNLIAQNNRDIFKTPGDYCQAVDVADEIKLKVTKNINVSGVGVFCSNPHSLSSKRMVSFCDGPSNDAYSGSIIQYDNNLKYLRKTKITSKERKKYSVTSDSKAISIGTGLFAVARNDDYVTILNSKGTVLRHLKVDRHSKAKIIPSIQQGDFSLVHMTDYRGEYEYKLKTYHWKNGLVKEFPIKFANEEVFKTQIIQNFFVMSSYDGYLGIYALDGTQIYGKIVETQKSLSYLAVDNEKFYFGSSSGRLYVLDLQLGDPREIYRAKYSGKIRGALDIHPDRPVLPSIAFAPVVLEDKIVIASNRDGRIHYLDKEGHLLSITQTEYVREILSFGSTKRYGKDIIVAGSITYVNFLDTEGNRIGEYVKAGPEHFNVPQAQSDNSFYWGHYRQISKVSLVRTGRDVTTTKNISCE